MRVYVDQFQSSYSERDVRVCFCTPQTATLLTLVSTRVLPIDLQLWPPSAIVPSVVAPSSPTVFRIKFISLVAKQVIKFKID